MALFHSVQAVYYVVVFLVYATVCGFSCVVLAHLKEKGKTHYRAWVPPGMIGNAFGTLLSLTVLGQFLLHLRPTVAFYYVLWAGQAVVAMTAVYAMVRLWQSVTSGPHVPTPLPSRNPSEAAAEVWPPPPQALP